jgi:predicted DCC family thiol-disulfide oxidoreductase YuxK
MRQEPKDLPVMLYDGDCDFCRYWIKKWGAITGGSVRYEPYQGTLDKYTLVTEKQCRKAVQLIMPGPMVFSGAHAVFKTLSFGGKCKTFLRLYERIPLFGFTCEMVYQLIGHSRWFLAKIWSA